MINRLKLLFFGLLLVASGSAFAEDYYWYGELGGTSSYAQTPEASCTAALAVVKSSFHSIELGGSDSTGPNFYWCVRVQPSSPTGSERATSTRRWGNSCTAPKVFNPATGVCGLQNCMPPNIEVNGVCKAPPPKCTKGERWVETAASGTSPSRNRAGCAASPVELLECYRISPAVGYCKWEVELTGDPAGADVPDTTAPPPSNPPANPPRVPSPPVPPKPDGGCIAGTVQAGQTASGAPICIGMGSAPDNAAPPATSSSSQTITDGDGTQRTATTVKRDNVDGSQTTVITTVVKKPDGSTAQSSTSNTTTATSGQPGASDGNKENKGLCEANPMLSICRNSTVSGTCGQISCTGDAIQCATLRAAAAMECREKESLEKLLASPASVLGGQIGTGSDPMKGILENHMKGTTVDLSNPNLDTAGFLGGGQCLAPIQFVALGRTVTYSFVSLCEQIQPLRLVIMALCSILAYLVVARSVLGGS